MDPMGFDYFARIDNISKCVAAQVFGSLQKGDFPLTTKFLKNHHEG